MTTGASSKPGRRVSRLLRREPVRRPDPSGREPALLFFGEWSAGLMRVGQLSAVSAICSALRPHPRGGCRPEPQPRRGIVGVVRMRRPTRVRSGRNRGVAYCSYARRRGVPPRRRGSGRSRRALWVARTRRTRSECTLITGSARWWRSPPGGYAQYLPALEHQLALLRVNPSSQNTSICGRR